MTLPHGLGALESPPDDRDFQLDALYTADELAIPLPPTFRVKVLPSKVFDQGTLPQCVAYSAATEQASFDLVDLGHNYLWDFAEFFRRIGGTQHGAIIRNALDRRLYKGYPLQPKGSGNSAGMHRIKAYYSVPRTRDGIKRALIHYGVCVIGTPWFNSWFDPLPDGTLPAPDYIVGGHAIAVVGYDARGVWLRNTWGADWGRKGECLMPWSYFTSVVREAWKAVDA